MAGLSSETKADGTTVHTVRYRVAGAGSTRPKRTFVDLADAELFKSLCEITGQDREPNAPLLRAAGLGWMCGDPVDGLTVREYAEKVWLGTLERPSAQTLKTYKGHLKNHVYPRIGHLPIASLTDDAMRQWQRDTVKATSAATTATIRASVVGPLIEHARTPRNGDAAVLAYNPLHGVPAPKVVAKVKEVPETVDEYAEYVSAILGDKRCDVTMRETVRFLAFCASTGLRISEALAIEVRDIAGGKCKIRKSKTPDGVRSVPFTEFHAQLLAEIMPESGPVFVSRLGRAMGTSNMQARIRRVRAVAESHGLIDMSCHAYRHMFTTLLDTVEAGVPWATRQEILGHVRSTAKGAGATGRYTQSTRKGFARVSEILTREFAPLLPLFA